MNIFQTLILVAAFYFMFDMLGMRGTAVRGDFMLYVMSGIFLFLTHTKAMGAVSGAEGPTSAMMKHAPMNTVVAIASAALGVALHPDPVAGGGAVRLPCRLHPDHHRQSDGAMAMLLLSWFYGRRRLAWCFWRPSHGARGLVGIVSTIYQPRQHDRLGQDVCGQFAAAT